jgi:hypothetical protein
VKIKLKYIIPLKGINLKYKITERKIEMHKYILIKLSDGVVVK